MEWLERKKDDWFILGLKGKLDALTSADVREKLMGVIGRGERKLILDCTNLDYVSSAGLRVLFEAAFEMNKAGGKIAASSVNANVTKIFKAVELQSDIGLFSTADEAMREA